MVQERKMVVAGIGEILFDIVDGRERLGGAPVNFAFHAHRLGAEGIPISTVGEDERGDRALSELQERGIAVQCISRLPGKATGYVEARLDTAGVASYHFPDDVAWDFLQLADEARLLASRLDAICFGTLAQRSPISRSVIRWYLEHLPEAAIKVYDINLRQKFYSFEIIEESLTLADVVKLNEDELVILAGLLELAGSAETMLRSLCSRFNLRLAILTRGERGRLLVAGKESDDHPGHKLTVMGDTIGAGDAFTAAVTLGLLGELDLKTINQRANMLAALVCGQSGAMVEVADTLKL